MLRAATPCTFSSSQLPKLLRDPSVFNTFYFQICFAPQRRALFQHLNFQKCSEPLQFLRHSTSKSASRHNAVHFFNISTSKSGPALRCFVPFHFEIGFAPQRRATFSSLTSSDVSAPAALASLLFNPPEPQNHEKTQCFSTFLPFRAPASSFF